MNYNNKIMNQLFPSSAEWSHVLFRLQLILADPSVELLSINKFTSEFQPKYASHMKIDCAIDVSQMQDHDLQNTKFNSPNKHIFQAGHIKLQKQQTKQNKKAHKMLLFKIAIDKSMPIHKSGAYQLQTINQFPQGIDTIYVSDSKQQLNIYPHKYKVKERGQCVLEYQVSFMVKGMNNINIWQKNKTICDYCQTEVAKYYCPDDKQLYCGRCYQQLHRSTKKKTHRQLQISPFNATLYCSLHQKQRQNHYCFDCMEMKCDVCVQNQVHKNDRNKKHNEIIEMTDLEIMLKQKQSAFLKQTKQRTKELILKAQDTLQKLNRSYESEKNDLQQKFMAKLTKLREQSNRKIMRIVSLHAEYRRKYDELLWMQNFMRFCEGFLLAGDNVKMRNSFFTRLKQVSPKEYYLQAEKNLSQLT